jgi:hypothetical protein
MLDWSALARAMATCLWFRIITPPQENSRMSDSPKSADLRGQIERDVLACFQWRSDIYSQSNLDRLVDMTLEQRALEAEHGDSRRFVRANRAAKLRAMKAK